ncbi:hypothetical protein [Mesorhizobium sp. NZP2298]|uniref:hypothetical protein n=1 Tax=Mesorhizobium sp. NZP2298 TaxID=2483403 RepID=UPI0015577BCD|nr:hypothetical protein [Mesorhizobium sp. NZP2298]QKC97279.1 hypothetical protein EB231_23285 [Mesorhizobium sp. NZP2298]
MPVADHLQAMSSYAMIADEIGFAIEAAMAKQPDLANRWVLMTHRMTEKYGSIQPVLNHADCMLDLAIRCMEDEHLAGATESPKPRKSSILAATMQIALSRLWVLSSYETLRTVRDTPIGKADERLHLIYRKFRLIRVPLAKMRVANADFIKAPMDVATAGNKSKITLSPQHTYILPAVLCGQTGSVLWHAIDTKSKATAQITRRELSDELLSLLEPV